MLEIFINNLLPIFLCAGAGFALGRRFKVDLRSVTRLAFYIFSPCLVFAAIQQNELSGVEFGQMALFTLAVLVVMGLCAWGTGVILRLDRPTLAALIVASVFVNGGNYGLALNQFAFGEQAVARAVVYYVFSTLAVYTFGILVAAAGRKSVTDSLKQIFAVPAAYALLLAGVMKMAGWSLPLVLERSVTLLSQAAIPVMLVILGLQIAEARAWPRARLGLIGVASFLQLIVAPLVGLGLAYWLGLQGVTRQAAVLEASMPTAVITTILAVEYDLDAAFMTGVVILSTLLSPLTLTPLLAYLK